MTEQEQWHLNKSVPITIVLTLLIQTAGIIIWGAKMDSRVAVLEVSQSDQDSHIRALETSRNDIRERLVVIEDRQNTVINRLNANAVKLDQIMQILSNKK